MIELSIFKKVLDDNEKRFPLLTLDEFFEGNAEEASIAPNQYGYGRPSLAEMWGMLRKIELMPEIEWVRVTLHDDTEIKEYDGKEILNLAGDSIVLCAAIQTAELGKLADCQWLCSDGIIEIEPSELNIYSCIPPIPKDCRCLEIVWE